MNTKDKLNLMKQIDVDNRKHIEEFIQAHMKTWVADYAFIDRDGLKRDWEPEDSRIIEETVDIPDSRSYTYTVYIGDTQFEQKNLNPKAPDEEGTGT